jgi:hypothetical protein
MTEHTPGTARSITRSPLGSALDRDVSKPEPGWVWAAQAPSSCSSLEFPESWPSSDRALTGHGANAPIPAISVT